MFYHTTGIRFLVDSGAQICIIPATKEDKKRGLHKFTFQVVNKSHIQTYGQRCLTLNLGLKRVLPCSGRKISYFGLARNLIRHLISPNQDDLSYSSRTFFSRQQIG